MIREKIKEKDQAWFDFQEISPKPKGNPPMFYTWTDKGRRLYGNP